MKYKKILFFAIFSCVLSCLPAQFSVTEVEQRVYAKAKKGFDIKGVDKRILDRHMGRLDTFVKWLDVAILTKSWDKITLYAKGVETFCELLISRNIDIANVPQDFFEMDLKLQEARDFLIEASEKKDLKALREEFKRMRVTCKKCHAKYKEDLKEGK